jgi:DNA-directed RNA polymerase specialized sigma24 family protein
MTPMFQSADDQNTPLEESALRRAFTALSPEQQRILWLVEVHGHTPASLSTGSRGANTIAARVYRARRDLRANYIRAAGSATPPEHTARQLHPRTAALLSLTA